MAAVELACGASRALISTHGAEALSWRAGAQDLIWRPDPKFWERSSPILFPAVGWRRDGVLRVDGRAYPMGVHGFAAQSGFTVAERSDIHVRMSLRDSRETRARYPFAFEFFVTYTLDSSSLTVALEVCNTGGVDLPYACGVHPGFRWPLVDGAKADHRVEFSAVEDPQTPIIAPGGLFSTESRAVEFDGRSLALSEETFSREALCFLNARSKAVRFAGPGGALACSFEGFPHLALWSRPGAPFLCIEGWTGHGDPVGYAGEFRDLPSILSLAPGSRREHSARFAFTPA